MDDDVIYEKLSDNTLSNTKITEVLGPQKTSAEVNSSGKQASNNSDKTRNKFDLPIYKCEVCSYESIWKNSVKRHQQNHYRDQRQGPSETSERNKKSKYQCHFCSYTASKRSIILDHQKNHTNTKSDTEQDEKNPTSDNKIEQNEMDPVSIKIDQKSNKCCKRDEITSIELYTCKICKHKTNSKEAFENHEKTCLQKDEVFRCDQCDFSSIYKQSYSRHMRTLHSSSEDVLYYCKYCGITSGCEHLKIHEKLKKMSETTDMDLNKDCQTNLPLQNLKSREIISNFFHNKVQMVVPNLINTPIPVQQPVNKTRRGKYSDVPVKTTKNGLFQCEHCSYQTAIRTALIKHQTNHLKNANS